MPTNSDHLKFSISWWTIKKKQYNCFEKLLKWYLQNRIKTNKRKRLRHQPSKSWQTMEYEEIIWRSIIYRKHWAHDVLKSCYDINTLGIGVVFWSRCFATSIISLSRKPEFEDLFTFNDSNLTKHGGWAFFEMGFKRQSCTIRVNLRHF